MPATFDNHSMCYRDRQWYAYQEILHVTDVNDGDLWQDHVTTVRGACSWFLSTRGAYSPKEKWTPYLWVSREQEWGQYDAYGAAQYKKSCHRGFCNLFKRMSHACHSKVHVECSDHSRSNLSVPPLAGWKTVRVYHRPRKRERTAQIWCELASHSSAVYSAQIYIR